MTILFNSTTGPVELSNFYDSPIQFTLRLGGHVYTFSNAEQAFHALKQKPYRPETILPFVDMLPGVARMHGKRVPLRDDWNAVRVPLMKAILVRKFANPFLQQRLMATDQDELIHVAPWDGFWGDGRDGHGRNELGNLLMQIRTQIEADRYDNAWERSNA